MTADVVKHLSKVLVVFILITVAWSGWAAVAKAESGRFPTRVWEVPMGERTTNVLLPDWSKISLASMPPIASNGSFDGSAYTKTVGYDLSRNWSAGMTPDQYLKLGDLSDALSLEVFSLDAISQLTELNLSQVSLDAFTLAGEQTLQQLVKIVPGLGNLTVADVPPVAKLLQTQLGNTVGSSATLAYIVTNPRLGQLQLNQIDLSTFSIDSIPSLRAIELQNFANWQNSFVSNVPSLNQVAFSDFPTPITEVGSVVMRIDTIYGSSEMHRNNTVSGSDQQGYSVPCDEKDCAYIELDDLENAGRGARANLEGKQWISGKYQEVEGGFGILGAVNGGKEPTGRHPFGSAFKVVVTEPDEATDTVDTALFFRFCNRGIPDLGCTPYFIGPIPFFTYKVNAPIFIGLLEEKRNSSASSQPTGATRSMSSSYGGGQTGTSNLLTPDCFTSANGSTLKLSELSEAIASIESAASGDFMAIGVYTCADGGGNCGRGLGRYQFMSYNEYATSLIAAKPNGQDFLKQVSRGYEPAPAELMQYFPPEDQNRAFNSSLSSAIARASQEIDPTTGQFFTGGRLIERVAQMHFGGLYSAVDGSSSDTLGSLSLRDYGRQVAARYQASNTTLTCAPIGRAGSLPIAIFPVRDSYRVVREFGAPAVAASNQHSKGIDVEVAETTPIYAAAEGKVIYAGHAEGYGNTIVLEHDNGRQTRYAHVTSIQPIVGTKVKQGDLIALTGSSTLHIEMREGAIAGNPFSGRAVNPRNYFAS
ncbi:MULTISPECIES: M23 family metallopeptidase [Cyanophyceae]|nr:M23 family metallopeptidase [Chroococcidiopsis sp. TS-821]AFZ33539.1 Peptidase M23 [Gloeocapsa sp. PCC 7428]PPS42044.1 peptidase M23 [Chroococcidiopsis sp. TS-821]